MASLLGLDVSHGGDVCVVVLRGELDAASAPELAACLDRLAVAGPCQVVLDLGGLSFADSSGLAAAAVARERFVAGGGNLVVRGASRLTRAVLAAMHADLPAA